MTDLKFVIAEEPDGPAAFRRAVRSPRAGATPAATGTAHRIEPTAAAADGRELRAPVLA